MLVSKQFGGFMNTRKLLTIGVHGGKFHGDEAVACAVVRIMNYNMVRIMRTRDINVLFKQDVVFDVGGVYDPASLRFDHHQRDFEVTGCDGRKLASAGLAWREFGKDCIRTIIPGDYAKITGLVDAVWEIIDREQIAEVDNLDNGVNTESKYGISAVISALNPPAGSYPGLYDLQFEHAVSIAEKWLIAVVKTAVRSVMDRKVAVETFKHCDDIAVFDCGNSAWINVYAELYKSGEHTPKLVVFPDVSGNWQVQSCPGDPDVKFSMVCPAPERWRGKRDFSTEYGTEVIFVHPAGFIGGAATKEAAMALAKEWLKG